MIQSQFWMVKRTSFAVTHETPPSNAIISNFVFDGHHVYLTSRSVIVATPQTIEKKIWFLYILVALIFSIFLEDMNMTVSKHFMTITKYYSNL